LENPHLLLQRKLVKNTEKEEEKLNKGTDFDKVHK